MTEDPKTLERIQALRDRLRNAEQRIDENTAELKRRAEVIDQHDAELGALASRLDGDRREAKIVREALNKALDELSSVQDDARKGKQAHEIVWWSVRGLFLGTFAVSVTALTNAQASLGALIGRLLGVSP